MGLVVNSKGEQNRQSWKDALVVDGPDGGVGGRGMH
jgi:hypothetical protein